MKARSIPVNPWAERYSKLLALSDDELKTLLAKDATPLPINMAALPPATAQGILRSSLKAIYLPTQQAIDIIRRILGRAHAHALLHYPTMEAFVHRIYEEHTEIEPSLAMAITGIAGIGKSQMIEALIRLLSGPELVMLPDGTAITTVAAARLTLGNKATEKAQRAELMRRLGAPLNEQGQRLISPTLLARRAYISGCCHLLMDEIQFKSTSSASAAVTKDLHAYTHVGPPFGYLANFSLIRKLMARRQEDQERLLANVVVMQPEDPESANLRDTIKKFNACSGGLLDLDPDRGAERLDFHSGGSRRAQVELIALGALMKWEQSKTGTRAKINLDDLEIAARSEGYASQRDTAALLRQQRATGRMADSKRADLWCPIQSACKLASRVAIEKAQDIERAALVLEAVRSQTPRTELPKPRVDSAAASAPVRKKRSKGPDIDQMLAQYASDRGIDDGKGAQSSP